MPNLYISCYTRDQKTTSRGIAEEIDSMVSGSNAGFAMPTFTVRALVCQALICLYWSPQAQLFVPTVLKQILSNLLMLHFLVDITTESRPSEHCERSVKVDLQAFALVYSTGRQRNTAVFWRQSSQNVVNVSDFPLKKVALRSLPVSNPVPYILSMDKRVTNFSFTRANGTCLWTDRTGLIMTGG